MTTTKLDPFTQRRLLKFVPDHRKAHGQPPTLQDLAKAGFSEEVVEAAIKDKLIEMFYVTMTNGTIVKVYKLA